MGFHMGFRLALVALFISSQLHAQTSQQRLIFPGDTLPAELTYKPLKLGSELILSSRDWFMLKDKDLAIAQPTPESRLNFLVQFSTTTMLRSISASRVE